MPLSLLVHIVTDLLPLGQAMCAVTVYQHTGHMHLAADFGFPCLQS